MFEKVLGFFHRGKATELKNRGNSLLAGGDLDAAEECYRKAIEANCRYAEAYNNLGYVLIRRGLLSEARPILEQAIRINPRLGNAHYNLATVLRDEGSESDAIEHFIRATEVAPTFEAAHSELAYLYFLRKDIERARAVLLNGLRHLPAAADFYNSLGNLFESESRLDDAVASYRKGLLVNPDFAEANNNLGNVLQRQGKLDEAVTCYRHALRVKPAYAEAHNNLGHALHNQGKIEEAIASYRAALSLKPDYALAHSNLIFVRDMASGEDTASLQEERKRWDAAHAACLLPSADYANDPNAHRRLRIGYVSADFRRHSAPSVFGAMLTLFNREQFDVFAYSNTSIEDEASEFFKKCVTGWRNIVDDSDEKAAERIRQDGIDVLIDLSGHSGGNRLLVFARKPAPIQITAWGYAASTGMKAMDVFFADPVIVPPEEKPLFTEEIRYLPCVVGYAGPGAFPDVNALPALSAGTVTFGSFNRIVKISDEALRLWAKVLAAVPGSRMLLKALELDDPATRDRMIERFGAEGIAPQRIALAGKSSWTEHAATFNRVDIGLDPFPHGGGVTALEGLMMGVPVVTLRIPTVIGRTSASIMTTLELTDWIAETPAQYVEIAKRKAQNLELLAELRSQMRGRFMASIFGNPGAYVKAVEGEYRQLWREWCVRQTAKEDTGVATRS